MADTPTSTGGGFTGSGFMSALGSGLSTMGQELSDSPAAPKQQQSSGGLQSSINNIGALSNSAGGAASTPTTAMPTMGAILGSPSPVPQAGKSGGDSSALMSAAVKLAPVAIAAFSDENAKKNIKQVDDKQVDEFVKSISPKSYDYKDKSDGGHVKAGMMAQDLAKSQLGSDAVQETSKGKMVDTTKLTMMMAPIFAKKLQSLEAKIDQALSDKFKKAK